MHLNSKTLDILAVIAHELQSRILCIEGCARVLSDDSKMGAQECRDYAKTLLSQCRAAEALIGNLTDETVLREGGFDLKNAPVRLRDLVDRSVEAFGPVCRARGVTLASHMPKQPLIVTGDVRRLGQVLDNLIWVALGRTKRDGKITVVVYEEDSVVCVGVVDNGEGIDPEHQARLFDQIGSSKRGDRGKEIGLFIAKKIVEAHGGEIGVHSAGLGKGSTVYFSLPKSRTSKAVLKKSIQKVS